MLTPPLTPLAAAALRVGEPERILEVECGEGEAALFLAREFPRARVRAVDRDEGAIRRATARVGLDPEGRMAFKAGAPGDLPFPDDLFDLVVAVDAAPNPWEAARVLRAGGLLLQVQTARRDPPGGLRGWLAQRRRTRAGFWAVASEVAGEGSFAVLRLAGESAPGGGV
jgi:ubiquinone/menaquinone biosynthesis C-methylase UbiE